MNNTSESFAGTVKAFRRRRMVSRIVFAGFLATTWGVGLNSPLMPYVALFFWLLFMVCAAARGWLKCSQCNIPLQTTQFRRCYKCGGVTPRYGIASGLWHCIGCGTRLPTGKGSRGFSVYSCRICGSHIHDEGL